LAQTGAKRVLPVNQVLVGNCVEVMKGFPAESIDMVMFSPPYYGLRDYGEQTATIWDNGWKGKLGLEPSWRMYVAHMVEVCREIKRVLKKTGSMYIVLGDTYAGSHCGKGDKTLFQNYRRTKVAGNLYEKPSPQAKAIDYKPKCLMGIPWRVAFALIEDGWILRNDIIWHKPNAMPSSVKDRLTQTYEHIFHLVKARRYYYDLDAIREPHKTAFAPFNLRVRDAKRGKGGISAFGKLKASKKEVEKYVYPESGRMRRLIQGLYEIAKQIRGQSSYKGKNVNLQGWKEACYNAKAYRDALKILEQREKLTDRERKFLQDYTQNHLGHPLGKNPGDVTSERVKANLAHFVPRGSGGHYVYGGLDSKEGKHRHPLGKNPGDVTLTKHDLALHVKAYNIKGRNPGDYLDICTKPSKGAHFAVYPEQICEKPIKACCPESVCSKCGLPSVSHPRWCPSCSCNNPTNEPGIVLDPMCGSGTTLVVAKKLGCRYIGIDINPEYVDIAIQRLLKVTPRKQRARAQGWRR